MSKQTRLWRRIKLPWRRPKVDTNKQEPAPSKFARVARIWNYRYWDEMGKAEKREDWLRVAALRLARVWRQLTLMPSLFCFRVWLLCYVTHVQLNGPKERIWAFVIGMLLNQFVGDGKCKKNCSSGASSLLLNKAATIIKRWGWK